MTGTVWGITMEEAQAVLKTIQHQYIWTQILPKDEGKMVKHKYIVEFTNGDKWYALSIMDNHVGHMTNISYINRDIKTSYIDNTIKPATTSMPFQAFHYYSSEYVQLLINENKGKQINGISVNSSN